MKNFNSCGVVYKNIKNAKAKTIRTKREILFIFRYIITKPVFMFYENFQVYILSRI